MSSVSTGCGTSCLRAGKVLYQISQDTKLYQWDPEFAPEAGTEIGSFDNFYELAEDQVNQKLFLKYMNRRNLKLLITLIVLLVAKLLSLIAP